MGDFSHAVVIGRFQPFHKAHRVLVDQALSLAPQVIMVLGSARRAPSLRNPWTAAERRKMIAAEFPDSALLFIEMEDSAYNPEDWFVRLATSIDEITGGPAKIVLVGHEKDQTSYYLQRFPQWAQHFIPRQAGNLSAEGLRRALFEKVEEVLLAGLSPMTLSAIGGWLATSVGQSLAEEYSVVAAYRQSWRSAPYPPFFVTADAMVVASGRVLVVRRGRHPGKGLLALPGGFVEAEERISDAIVRELIEETQLAIEPAFLKRLMNPVGVFDDPYRDPRGRIVTQVGLFNLGNLEPPAVSAADDAAEAFWLPLAEVRQKPEQFFSDHALIVAWFLNRMN